jgi:hypothetical protein
VGRTGVSRLVPRMSAWSLLLLFLGDEDKEDSNVQRAEKSAYVPTDPVVH